VRDAAGLLACPDDASGLDVVSLSNGNAEAATRRMPRVRTDVDGALDTKNTVPYPGFVSPDGHKGTF
jgi:hypothetical protein